MASTFTGTLDKCKVCDKTVYFVVAQLFINLASNAVIVKGLDLVMSSYSSMDGVLYCKPHFEQLFKESGNFSKNFQNAKSDKDNFTAKAPSKASAMFCGTQDKCPACHKTVYPFEKMTMEGESFHKSCFKCAHGGCHLTHSSNSSWRKEITVLDAATNKKSVIEPTRTEGDTSKHVQLNEGYENGPNLEHEKAQEQS